MNAWTVVVLAGLGSFAFRLSIVAFIDHIAAPEGLERLATFVMPAAFAGIAAAALAHPIGAGGTEALAPMVAVVTTAIVSGRGHSIHLAFLAGLGALWVTTALTTMI